MRRQSATRETARKLVLGDHLTRDILAALEGMGFQALHSPVHEESRGTTRFEGDLTVEGHVVRLRIVLDRFFPLSLPRIFLSPWNALGWIPHIDPTGNVCFADQEGMVLDGSRPVEIVKESVNHAKAVLSKGVLKCNQGDFVDEFDYYWRMWHLWASKDNPFNIPGASDGEDVREHIGSGTGAYDPELIVHSVLDPPDEITEVLLAWDPGGANGKEVLWLCRSEKEINAYFNGRSVADKTHRFSGVYIPLLPDTVIIPLAPGMPFWTASDIRHMILSGLSQANQRRLEKLMAKRSKRVRDHVIVGLPRPAGGTTLFGFRCDAQDGPHSLWKGRVGDRLFPLIIDRRDRGYLVQRGGGTPALGGKKVLLVGCGAVGGHLAFELARAGVLDLTVIDPDMLKPENTFRHVLGREHWGRPKVEALKESIEAQLPYVQVTSHSAQIEKGLEDGSINLEDYDLVVAALGKPTIELDINSRVQALAGKPAALFTWLEPLGIGGHAVLTHNGSGRGCFQCLFSSPGGYMDNKASFAAPGQFFGRTLSGCENMHTPYGSVDAVRTATLASRLAIDALTGREKGNPLLSWKGDASAFLAEEFKLSAEYDLPYADLYNKRYAYRTHSCPVCGSSPAARSGAVC